MEAGKQIEFRTNVNYDNGYTNTSMGVMDNTMQVFLDEHTKTPRGIEWVVNDGEFVEFIGLWFDGRTLTDYDGVFELPKEAIKLIRSLGYRVPKEFED